jgi:hypothetical protein
MGGDDYGMRKKCGTKMVVKKKAAKKKYGGRVRGG